MKIIQTPKMLTETAVKGIYVVARALMHQDENGKLHKLEHNFVEGPYVKVDESRKDEDGIVKFITYDPTDFVPRLYLLKKLEVEDMQQRSADEIHRIMET